MSENVGDELDFIVVNVEHVDSSDDESKDDFILKERRRAIKTKASLVDEPPRLILNNVANINYSEEVLTNLPSYEFLQMKCMRSKIQELGLIVEYRENKKIKDCLKLPQMLGFLPLDGVIPAFEELKTLRIEDENV
ncbi:unnamed protein product [Brachionus calyciflorus]|uniref:Uncharacterized protein n=1 Tax=Brachionus calyciflorus TaxID=104777 RepID=A0A813WRG7_9BILA|nr:unnamed protein product [Brachionus calyciflorus]